MNKYENPMIYISLFEAENVVTTSSAQTNTYAANELNKAMFAQSDADETTTGSIFNFQN